ncbi:MAG: Ig-like domain repeat protein [Acidobacteriota bacterium]
MSTRRSVRWLLALVVVLAYLGAGAAGAQVVSSSRVEGDWRSTGPAVLTATAPPLAISGTSEGPAPGNEPLPRMLLLLQPSPAQQQALSAQLAALQDPNSPQYHHWLSASAFADAYANSPAAVAAVVAWLQSQGFQVAPLPAGRGWIEFSGTVSQVEQAFQAQMEMIAGSGGSPRPVLAGSISVPAALRPIIAGLVSLDGVVSLPALTTPQPLSLSSADLNAETSPTSAAALTPRLEQQLLDLAPLAAKGVTGAGQKIAIAARSNVNAGDVAAFRAAFALPASPLAVDLDGTDPGLTDAQAEATLAASWAGAVAPGAQVLLVPAATTNATDGVDLSLAAIVDRQLAGTVAVGFSACEAGMSAAHHEFYSALYEQAAAEGITIVAATGDSGAAACSAPGGTAVTTGYGVNAMASTPWDTAVGVAGFATSSAGLAGWSPRNAADPAYAGGGGSSTLYGAQRWQPAPAQLPAGYRQLAARQLPDLSLPAAIDTGSNPGLAFCLSAAGSGSGCTLVRSGGSGAAAGLFAGIAALRAQQQGAQGDLTPALYQFSQSGLAFRDVAQGSTQLPCTSGSPGCGSSGQIGFTAAVGYDLATGLGVPDAASLVMAQVSGTGTTPASVANTTASGQTINPSGSLLLSAAVTSSTGSGVPSGTVTFYDQSTSSNIVTISLAAATSDSSTASQTVTGALAQGSHSIIAEYSGDSTFAPANSAAVMVTAQPSSTAATVTPANTSPTGGSSLVVTAVVSSANAGAGALAPSGSVTFNVDSVSVGSSRLIAGVASGAATNSSTSITITAPYATGAHQIVAVYNGDTNYTGSTSPAATINVSASTPTVSLTPSTTTPGAGGSVTLNALVAPPGSGTGARAPTGTVQFLFDGAPVATVAVTDSVPATAAFTVTGLAQGSHTAQANYSGDTNYSAANSGPVTLTVSKMGTTLTLNLTNTSPAGNTSLPVSATLTPAGSTTDTATGTVTFSLDGNPVSTVALAGGNTANTNITVPASGTHTVQATYSGDTNFSPATSSSITLTVAKTPTTTAVIPSTTTPSYGATVPVNATVTPASVGSSLPTGTVTFTLDGVTQSIQTLTPGSPGTASTTLPALTPGTHTLNAAYSGDTYYASSTSGSVSLSLPKITTTMSVAPATTAPAGGNPLSVSATITASSNINAQPTGTVTFTLDGAAVATAQVVPGMPAVATATIPSVPGGTHVLAATYSGDTNYTNATAPGVTLTASKSPTTMTLGPSTLTPTAGSSLSVAISVISTTSGTGPTGTVTVMLDGTPVATGTLTPGTPSTATVTIPMVAAGTHVLAASYAGDASYSSSTATPVTITAGKGTTVTTVTATPSALVSGTAESLKATITPAAAVTGVTYTFTGQVSFYDGTKLLGQAPVTGNSATLAGLTLAANISHAITAVYSGDANWLGSTSATLPLAATTLPDTIVLTANTTNPTPGQAVVLTVTVTPTSVPLATAEQNPTGTVVFYNGTTPIGTAGLVAQAGTYSSIATLTTSTLPGGPVTVSAYYKGDLAYDAGPSNTVSLTVQNFIITPDPTNPATNLNIVRGGAGSVSFDVTALGGFAGTIQLECQVPPQDNMTCAATPQQVTPPGTVTFTIQTYTTTPPSTTSRNTPWWPQAAGGTALAGLVFFLLPFGRRARAFLAAGSTRLLILVVLLAGIVGAAVGCSSTTSGVVGTGTPLGVATVKVVGNAYVDNTVVSQSVYFTVNVLAQ